VRRLVIVASLVLLLAPGASDAHDGPPYPIVVDRNIGLGRLSAWADPDVGTGTFLISLEPDVENPLPRSCTVFVRVRPADGHASETRHEASPRRVRKKARTFETRIPFDAIGPWNVAIDVESEAGRGRAETQVQVTPPGQGPVLDFVLYLFPFAAVAFLFAKAALRKRSLAKPAPPVTD
jgi:hypothetical protein